MLLTLEIEMRCSKQGESHGHTQSILQITIVARYSSQLPFLSFLLSIIQCCRLQLGTWPQPLRRAPRTIWMMKRKLAAARPCLRCESVIVRNTIRNEQQQGDTRGDSRRKMTRTRTTTTAAAAAHRRIEETKKDNNNKHCRARDASEQQQQQQQQQHHIIVFLRRFDKKKKKKRNNNNNNNNNSTRELIYGTATSSSHRCETVGRRRP
jgi:hypothetical protein